MKTQLLCTFAHRKDLELIADYVAKSYTVSEKRMFVFSDADSKSELYVTYNVEPDDYKKTPNTIMIHRKKETNTLYTVNALNVIIKAANNGILDNLEVAQATTTPAITATTTTPATTTAAATPFDYLSWPQYTQQGIASPNLNPWYNTLQNYYGVG